MWLTAADGTKLHAWLLVPRGWSREMKRTRPLVMFFQVIQRPALDTLLPYCFVTARLQLPLSGWLQEPLCATPSPLLPAEECRQMSLRLLFLRLVATQPQVLLLSSSTHLHPPRPHAQENAGNMSHRLPFLRLVATQLQVPIFALDYRGYGSSEGVPNQAGIMLDAQVCGCVCICGVCRGACVGGLWGE